MRVAEGDAFEGLAIAARTLVIVNVVGVEILSIRSLPTDDTDISPRCPALTLEWLIEKMTIWLE